MKISQAAELKEKLGINLIAVLLLRLPKKSKI